MNAREKRILRSRNDALDKFKRVLELAEKVIQSADDTGCNGNLTVVRKNAVDDLEDFIVNHCGEDELPEVRS